MAEIIGVRFKSVGKVYYFEPGALDLSLGDQVIVETSRGTECGTVVIAPKTIPDEELTKPLKRVTRKATPEDLKRIQDNHEKEKQAFQLCSQMEKKI